MWILYTLGISLILTIIFELLFFMTLGIRDKKTMLLVCLVNVITNPPVVLCFYLITSYTRLDESYIKIILEFIAILTEEYYYKTYAANIKYPYLIAISANIVSFSIGMLINYIT